MGPGLFDAASAPPVGESSGGPLPEAARSGWTPPAALGPRSIEALFTARTRLRCGSHGWHEGQIATVREPWEAGTLRLPTGRVIAADPGFVNEDSEPFTVTVVPGEYPVSIGSATCEIEVGAGDDRVAVVDERVTAVRVLICNEPAVTWEMALLPGQDPRMLPAGEFFGFGVDSGTAAFLDAEGRQALPARYPAVEEYFDDRPAGLAWWAEDPGSGANMVAYNAGLGDGVYPVWIGRDAEGQVVSIVADMLLLGDAELLPSAAASTARYVLPGPEPGTDAGLAARPARAAELSRYVDELLVPLKSAAAQAFAEEPVDMPVSAVVFGPPGRPELRFPDHDRAVEAGTDIWSHTRHGHMFRQTMRAYDRALDAYTRAIELDPDCTVVLGGRGDTFRLLGVMGRRSPTWPAPSSWSRPFPRLISARPVPTMRSGATPRHFPPTTAPTNSVSSAPAAVLPRSSTSGAAVTSAGGWESMTGRSAPSTALWSSLPMTPWCLAAGVTPSG